MKLVGVECQSGRVNRNGKKERGNLRKTGVSSVPCHELEHHAINPECASERTLLAIGLAGDRMTSSRWRLG